MTETKHTPTLEPCPFCGSNFKISQEAHDNHPVGGMFYIYHEYGPVGSAARNCPIEVNRHFDSSEEAVTAWNRRAVNSHTALVEALRPFAEKVELVVDDLGENYRPGWSPFIPQKAYTTAARVLSAALAGEKDAPKTLVDNIPDADWDNWDASDENPNVADSAGIEDAPDDGWTPWKGGECPVGENDHVDIRFLNGTTLSGVRAGGWSWQLDQGDYSIDAYRRSRP